VHPAIFFQLKEILKKTYPVEVTRTIRLLLEKKMLDYVPGKQRIYMPVFSNNYLLRGVIEMLKKNNFIPFD
jgi:hypothetical protein